MSTHLLTHEEQLRQISQDFQQYIDGDTQLRIGATFDKPLTERIRIALQDVGGDDQWSDLKEDLREANGEIKELESRIEKQNDLINELSGKVEKFKVAARAVIA